MNVLEVDNISVRYGDIQALWDVGFGVREGQLVTILGTNGAGKTTTLKTIAGVLQPFSGNVRFNGSLISGLPAHEVADAGISLVPEGRQLFPQLNVEDNLRMGSYLKRTKVRRDQNLKSVYNLFPVLAERKKQEAQTLSGGEQQMLAIGRALMQDPKLIMFDEPSLGLAPILVQEVFNIIRELSRQGRTILLVEQNVHQALKISDYCYVLENGRIVHEGTGKDLEQDPKVREAYLGI
ncbi:leucine/isoleucine/valine transporter subunit; ATP-binding component of ABC superfamily [Desulfosarcina cetonica]|uniref:ABC transporter ATP-binding protein n=1 Tax=Desulfosarcina cetonica TaxID=90730 RepID=UPI0006D13D71|nr:ABC transporter ATP-binding protein [Desulfosarcina cetonica]VTR70100.1 leucine/isoleucine/valine transporter subunit; ATP-binding component of ABC superfamily [Desulfosarcina cetonica]